MRLLNVRRRYAFALVWFLGASLIFAAEVSAEAGGQASATPSRQLVGGQYVNVEWESFPEWSLVYLRQCKAKVKSLDDCSSSLTNAITRKNGTGTSIFRVVEGKLPDGAFTCDYERPCSIGLFVDDAEDVSNAVYTPIRFAFPPSACPKSDATFVSGSGSSAANLAMLRWAGTTCRKPHDLPFQYTLKNSVEGRLDFARGITDFGVSSGPFKPTEQSMPRSKPGAFTYAPITASSLVFGYRLFDQETGERITELKLAPELIAQIFTGQIQNWNHAGIKSLNPNYRLPSLLRAVGRADQSASTLLLTRWLEEVAQEEFRAGGDAFTGPTEIFPSNGSIDLKTGAAAVSLEVASPSEGAEPNYGYIGWMDASYAELYGLPTAKIENAAGHFVEATPGSVSASLTEAKVADDGILTPNFTSNEPAAYPLPVVSYIVAPTKNFDAKKGAALASLIRYAARDGQQNLPSGYTRLHKNLVDIALAAAGDIPTRGAGPDEPEEPEGPGGPSETPEGPTDPNDPSGTPLGPTDPSTGIPVASTGDPTVVDGVEPPVDATGKAGDVPAPLAAGVQAVPAGALARSPSRILLPLLVILGCMSLIAGPVLQLAGKPRNERWQWLSRFVAKP